MRYRRTGGERGSAASHKREVSQDAGRHRGHSAMTGTMAGSAPAVAGKAIGNVCRVTGRIYRDGIGDDCVGCDLLQAKSRSEHDGTAFSRRLTGTGENKQA